MASDWLLNFDSAPFCNGSLHVGHARNYVLGDVRARWLRLRGERCRYVTAFDAFGQANAGPPTTTDQGIRAAAASVRANTDRIQQQFIQLGLSHSSNPPSSSDPGYYRWTQWLFLELWSAGLVHWECAPVLYCPTCDSALASLQSENGRCWRCAGAVARRRERQCYIRTSAYHNELVRGIDALRGWSARSRKLLDTAMADGRTAISKSGDGAASDWMVSRNHGWGTPVPAVDCPSCGIAPVRSSDLPVLHVVHGGSGSSYCDRCGRRARLVDRTLDCFFDDAWCFYAGARQWTPGDVNPFVLWRDDPPREVHFHAGYDTYAYLPLYRFVGRFLWQRGYTPRPEPIDFYHGHDVVTAAGHKISKRYGNGPDMDALLGLYGADTLRLSVLAGINPSRPLDWSDRQLTLAQRFFRMAQKLAAVDDGQFDVGSDTSAALVSIDRFIESYRMAAALDRLYTASRDCLRQPLRSVQPGHVQALLSRWLVFCPQLAAATRRSSSRTPVRLLTRQTA